MIKKILGGLMLISLAMLFLGHPVLALDPSVETAFKKLELSLDSALEKTEPYLKEDKGPAISPPEEAIAAAEALPETEPLPEEIEPPVIVVTEKVPEQDISYPDMARDASSPDAARDMDGFRTKGDSLRSYDIMKSWSLRQAGSLRNETALRISEPKEVTKIKNQFILSGTGKVSENIRFKISGRAWFDAVYYWTDNFGTNVRSDEGTDLEWRDTYLDLSYGPFDLRLGKQQVVWGEAVALFYADVVNGRDLREFILPDFDMIRIPQWGLDLEYSRSNFHAEFVWLPDVELDKLGVSGSEFAFAPPIPSLETLYAAYDAPDVNSSFKNGNVGGRLSYLYDGLDIGAFYYHTWTKSPVYYRTILNGAYIYVPEYRRLNLIGATFSKEIKGIVLKGEFVYTHNDYFPINDPSSMDGIIRRSSLDYLLGLDYTFFGKLETNLQFMQNVVFDYKSALINTVPVDNLFALRLKTDFFDGRLEPEFTAVTSLMKTDMMLRPKISFKIDDNWRFEFGSDIFIGRWNGPFGQFHKKSRIYFNTICSF